MKRTPTRAEGGITEQEKEAMAKICEKWKNIAFQTGSVNKDKLTEAIERLYSVSGLKKPKVVIVPSPVVMAFAYGISAGWWWNKKNKATAQSTDQATRQATLQATRQATDQATAQATRQATVQATLQSTLQATDQATYQATYQSTDQATRQATLQATLQATYQATDQATLQATLQATVQATLQSTLQATDQSTYQSTDQATYQATLQATLQATDQSTDQATAQATAQATYQATDQATRQATRQSTLQATAQATDQATRQATRQATLQATLQATDQATDQYSWLKDMVNSFSNGNVFVSKVMLKSIVRWSDNHQGGNMWAAFPSYCEAMRDIIGLNGLGCWNKWKAWEDCSKYGGFRVMHPEFCMVSEFPEVLKVNVRGQSHCETGPSHKWKDGFELYHLNGIRVPKWLVMTEAGKINPKLALEEKNVDVQREIIRKVGAERMLKVCDAKTLDVFIDRHSKGGNEYKLMRMKVGEIDRKYLYFEHASLPGVWYAQPVEPNLKKAIHARAWMLGVGEVKELEKMSDEKIKELLPLNVS